MTPIGGQVDDPSQPRQGGGARLTAASLGKGRAAVLVSPTDRCSIGHTRTGHAIVEHELHHGWPHLAACIQRTGSSIARIGRSIQDIRCGVTRISRDVSRIGHSVPNIGGKVSRIDRSVSNIGGNVSRIGRSVSNIGRDVSNIWDGISRVDRGIRRSGCAISHIGYGVSPAAVTHIERIH
jgi:phage-related protein